MQYIIEQMNNLQNQVSKLVPSINNNRNTYNSGNVLIENGTRKRIYKFSVDDVIISHSEVMERLKEFKQNNPDIKMNYSITGNTLTVECSAFRGIMFDGLLKYVLDIDGVQLSSDSKYIFDAIV